MDLPDLHGVQNLQLRSLQEQEVQAVDPPFSFHDLDLPREQGFILPARDDLDAVDLPPLLEIRAKEMVPVIVQRPVSDRRYEAAGIEPSPQCVHIVAIEVDKNRERKPEAIRPRLPAREDL